MLSMYFYFNLLFLYLVLYPRFTVPHLRPTMALSIGVSRARGLHRLATSSQAFTCRRNGELCISDAVPPPPKDSHKRCF
jgi:hypothetical protein